MFKGKFVALTLVLAVVALSWSFMPASVNTAYSGIVDPCESSAAMGAGQFCMVADLVGGGDQLSDLGAGYSGNFTVWPGSHLILAEHLRTNGHEVLKMGMPELRWPAEPIMLTGQPGDIVLAHHLLVHEGAPNTSNTVRQAVIFRVCHKDCRENALAGFTTIWREWPGLM